MCYITEIVECLLNKKDKKYLEVEKLLEENKDKKELERCNRNNPFIAKLILDSSTSSEELITIYEKITNIISNKDIETYIELVNQLAINFGIEKEQPKKTNSTVMMKKLGVHPSYFGKSSY